MSDNHDRKGSAFRRPEMIVALSAIVLSVCGLFIALYEASIARRAEQASVWPHIEIATSVQGTHVQIWVRNTGVGPARVRAANIRHEGNVVSDWAELMRAISIDTGQIRRTYSVIGGRVLGVDTEVETIFAIDVKDDSLDSDATMPLAAAVFDGLVDVELCYCSVYNECWIARMQDVMNRELVTQTREDEGRADCSTVPQSGI